ncbi:hypothetical protein OAC51_10040 [Flavobacteriaceae bacterium]|nr:hypothetical protein [Flavobacteriaceae bacterium]
MESSEIIQNIGKLIFQSANLSAENWDYAIYVYSYEGGGIIGGQPLLYKDRKQIKLQTREIRKELRANFFKLLDITHIENADHWIKCLVGVKNKTKEIKVFFEFEKMQRWKITPVNAANAYNMIIGEVFKEDI